MKISDIIRVLLIIWFAETLIASVLYAASGLVTNINIRFLFLLKAMHFIYYYWLLFLVYYLREEDFSVKFFCVTNSIVFLVISFFLSLYVIKDTVLFFDYSFVCNLSAIILAPYLLKKINTKLPSHLRIY